MSSSQIKKQNQKEKELIKRIFYYWCNEDGNNLQLFLKGINSPKESAKMRDIKVKSGAIYKYLNEWTKERKKADGTIIPSRQKVAVSLSPTAAAKKIYKKLYKFKQIRQDETFYIRRTYGNIIYKFKAGPIYRINIDINRNSKSYKFFSEKYQKRVEHFKEKYKKEHNKEPTAQEIATKIPFTIAYLDYTVKYLGQKSVKFAKRTSADKPKKTLTIEERINKKKEQTEELKRKKEIQQKKPSKKTMKYTRADGKIIMALAKQIEMWEKKKREKGMKRENKWLLVMDLQSN